VRTARVNALLGTDLDAEDVWDALAPLGIDLDGPSGSGEDSLVATVPSFRPDLDREIDLVEEVARRIGFDRIGRTRPDTHGQVGMLSARQRDRRVVADALVGRGLSEAITLSLVAPADLERAGAPLDRMIRAANPLRSEESVLRTGILPGLLRAVAYNRSHGLVDVALFEQGRVFLAPSGEGPLPDEPEQLAVVIAGTVQRAPIEPDRPVDVHDAVDALRAVVDALRVATFELLPADGAGYRQGSAARVLAGGREVGTVGEVAPEVLDALGLAAPVVAFEVELDALTSAPRRDQGYVAPSRFPASMIDLAFVVERAVPAAAIEATLRGAVGDVLEDVRCFDEFRDEALGEGRRSLAFALRFRAADRTFGDAEVTALRRRAIDAVVAEHGATLRGDT